MIADGTEHASKSNRHVIDIGKTQNCLAIWPKEVVVWKARNGFEIVRLKEGKFKYPKSTYLQQPIKTSSKVIEIRHTSVG